MFLREFSKAYGVVVKKYSFDYVWLHFRFGKICRLRLHFVWC